YTAHLGSNDFQIARKSPEKLRDMMIPVYDNDYVVPKLITDGMPQRWQPWAAAGATSPWKTSADYKSFEAESTGGQPAWLRYEHILPNDQIWDDVKDGQRFTPPGPQLIGDFYAYNAGRMSPACETGPRDEAHWVGDLALACQLEVTKAKGAVTLELEKGGR